MSAWLLPDHIADVLPIEARRIEELRRSLLDVARCYGYELVMPPLLEHQESLLTGAGQSMDLNTFKLVDQLSGRMLALRADMTSQVARLDAHLLNREGVTRLCYCGPVVHTRPNKPHATREPLQLGAEIYGHAGLEADLEIHELALNSLQAAGVKQMSIDLADVRIVQGVLASVTLTPALHTRLYAALSAKDAPELKRLSQDFPETVRQDLAALIQLYGDVNVLAEAERRLTPSPLVSQALADLRWMAQHLPNQTTTFDLADLRGYAYYSGMCFAIYVQGANDAVVRGGRYDEVGAVFGRNRPAVGFSLDLKELAAVAPTATTHTAIRAPWGQAPELRAAIEELRAQGHTVVCVLPGLMSESCEFHCDRELKNTAGQWVVTPC